MNSLTAFDPQEKTDRRAPVIQLDQIGVRYRAAQERIPSIKEYAIRWLKGQIRVREFWALQDLSLQVLPGEVFGIIGPNGAGKSTLLKVVARVLKPTQGRVRVRGRISPLLELGAGFDQELTGRENIYLNGAILGFSKADLERRFDRIVEFAGLGAFIDAPIRTYSTGMVARLGFAVATDVRPEVLIVDEILGVGDAEFQNKSFERIQSFQAQGTTILLVSHSLDKIREMCSRVVWLDHGKVITSGNAEAVVADYLMHTTRKEAERLAAGVEVDPAYRRGTRKIEITGVQILDAAGQRQTVFQTGEALCLEIDYLAHEAIRQPVFGMAIHHNDGAHVTGPNTAFAGLDTGTVQGPGKVVYTIPKLPLLEGLYHVSVAAINQQDTEIFDYHDRLYLFRVINQQHKAFERYGMVTVQGEWQHFVTPEEESGDYAR